MLDNVIFERKNLLYEELLEQVIAQRMLVTCCIDAHFTAFQVRARVRVGVGVGVWVWGGVRVKLGLS